MHLNNSFQFPLAFKANLLLRLAASLANSHMAALLTQYAAQVRIAYCTHSGFDEDFSDSTHEVMGFVLKTLVKHDHLLYQEACCQKDEDYEHDQFDLIEDGFVLYETDHPFLTGGYDEWLITRNSMVFFEESTEDRALRMIRYI